MKVLLFVITFGMALVGCGSGDSSGPPKPAPQPKAPVTTATIQQKTCPVMGNPINPEVFVDYQGRRIYFCCPGCDKTFLKDPAKYLPKVDADIAGKSPEPAPAAAEIAQKRCPVMGNRINPDVHYDYEGRRIYFCCPPCIDKFKQDPKTYLAKVDKQLEAGK